MDETKYIGLEISKINNMLTRKFSKSKCKQRILDTTGKNGWIIEYIAQNSDKEIFQRDIEEQFLIRRSTVSNMIQLMEKKGYIERKSVNYDARLKKLELTYKAWEMYDDMQSYFKENETTMRKDISDELPMYTKLFILTSVGVLMNAPNRIIKGKFRA